MSGRWCRTLLCVAGLVLHSPALVAEAPPGVSNPELAKVDYMLNCQGCHGPDGSGTPDGSVPTLKNFMGNFLRVDGGREFLIQVPGSANAALSDARLAEVVNWMLAEMSSTELPQAFQPYTAAEVKRLRASPLGDVAAERERLIRELAGARQTP